MRSQAEKPLSTVTYSQIKELTVGTDIKLAQEYNYVQFRITRLDRVGYIYRRVHTVVGQFSTSKESLYPRVQVVRKIEELNTILKEGKEKLQKTKDAESEKKVAREKQRQSMLNDVLGDAKLPSNVSLDMYSGNYMISAYGLSKEMVRRLALILILGEPTD